MSELATTFSREDYYQLIDIAVKTYPTSSSIVADKVQRATTRLHVQPSTGDDPQIAADYLQNLSQIDFLELIVEIIEVHPQFTAQVRKACNDAAGRCPPPADYETIKEDFKSILEGRGDCDPDIHGSVSSHLEELVEMVEESVNFNFPLAVLDDAFRCLCALEDILLDDDEEMGDLEANLITSAMVKVGMIWKANGGVTGTKGDVIKNKMANLVKKNKDGFYDDICQRIWGLSKEGILLEREMNRPSKPKSVAKLGKRARLH